MLCCYCLFNKVISTNKFLSGLQLVTLQFLVIFLTLVLKCHQCNCCFAEMGSLETLPHLETVFSLSWSCPYYLGLVLQVETVQDTN